jgi:DnaJ-class molecular chaperone
MGDKNSYCFSDAYKYLGIQPSADDLTIKKAYRDLAKRYHPDVNPDDPEAEARFKKIQWAYDLLKEGRDTKPYDNQMRCNNMNGGFGVSGHDHPFSGFYEALKRSGRPKNNL